MRLKGKVAVITGGATGIGRAAALQFGLDGAEVIVADVNDVEGVATARAITQVRGAAQFVRTDVSSETDVRALMKDVDDACGHLDILVNCAGIFQGMEVRVDDFEDDRWELFDLSADPAETNDLSQRFPDRLRMMQTAWQEEAERFGALPLSQGPAYLRSRYRYDDSFTGERKEGL